MLTQTMITESPRPVDAPAPGRPPGEGRLLGGPIDLMGACMSFARNEEIYGEGEPAEYLYKVVSGTVRTSKILADGRRQIGAFYQAGDMFGLEMGDEHTSRPKPLPMPKCASSSATPSRLSPSATTMLPASCGR